MTLTTRAAMALVTFTVAVLGACATSAAASATAPIARAASTLTVRDTISLRLVRKSGSVLYESGSATGTLPGRVTARFDTGLTKVTGSVTISPRSGGSVTINVVGYPRSAGTIATFSGDMAVRKGTGRYADALGSGTFTGTVNRSTWAVTVNATARLTY